MARALTHPPDDKSMWRRALAKLHPDGGGSHDLFIGAVAVRDVVCDSNLRASAKPEAEDPSRRREASTSDVDQGQDRVPFDASWDFASLTDRAVTMASAVAEPYALLLRSCADCYPATEGPLFHQQRRGASYRQLAAVGHLVGMSGSERARWYSVARAVPLSQRHAGHILGKLQKAKPEAAA
jgi:hypothetical protein